ncbi:MAG: hypothetical protein J5666_02620 [Bacilli bacterium]|nr:hypothetical protein [Bacilli bacterium]
MKTLKRKTFRIQQRNQHLKNILDENYYIELGAIDIKTLDRLTSGALLSLKDIIYEPLASEGLGQITTDASSDLLYQFNFLNSLRKNSSSDKIFLTCGVLHYKVKTRECYAPIILIPVDLNLNNQTIIAAGEAMVNTILVNDLQSILDIELPTLEHNAKTYEIEKYCNALATSVDAQCEVGNFLTAASIEYNANNLDFEDFDTQRSIYEKDSLTIYDEYFKKVKAVTPTNIYQKWVLLKISDGASFVVDGRLSTGKTSTIINAIADAIIKKKHVLYVCQDMDSIDTVENKLYNLNLLPYTYNLCQGYLHKTYPEKEFEIPRHEKIGIETLSPISDYEKALNASIHGCRYSEIVSCIALIRNREPDIARIPIDVNLERNEIKEVYLRLKEIEEILNTIEPLDINVWRKIEQYYDKRHIKEIIDTTVKYYDASKRLYRLLKDYCKKYDINLPENFISTQKLFTAIEAFTYLAPPKEWVKNFNQTKIKEILASIHSFQTANQEILTLLKQEVIPEYQTGQTEELVSTLLHNGLRLEDGDKLSHLLNGTSKLEELIQTIKQNQKQVNEQIKRLEDLLDQPMFGTAQLSYVHKLSKLLSSCDIPQSWVEFYLKNKTIIGEFYQSLEDKLNKFNNLKEEILTYLLRPQDFSYSSIKASTNSSDFAHNLSELINKKEVKKNHKTYNDINHLVLDFIDIGDEIKNQAYKFHILDKFDVDGFVAKYGEWIKFYFALDAEELVIYKHQLLVKAKNIVNKQDFMRLYSDFSTCCDTLEDAYNALSYYGIDLTTTTIMDKNAESIAWLKYLEQAIKTIAKLAHLYKGQVPTVKQLVDIINADKNYLNIEEQLEVRSEEARAYLGATYLGLETDCERIENLINDYSLFLTYLKTKDTIKTLYSSGKMNDLIAESVKIDQVIDENLNIHNNFSRYFMGGQPKLLEKPLDEVVKLLSKYEERTVEIKPLFVVFENVRFFEKLGLKKLCDGILKSKYSKGIADTYIYSTYLDYQNELVQKNPVLQENGSILLWLDNFNYFEYNYNQANIAELMRGYQKQDKRNSAHIQNIPFNDYNHLIDDLYSHKRVFLADIDIFNGAIDLSRFDLILVDDIHLSSVFKYQRVMEASQVVMFGDSSRLEITSNNAFNKIPKRVIFRLTESYAKDNTEYGNIPNRGNQYIYDFHRTREYFEASSLSELASKIIKSYQENVLKKIDIIYANINYKLLIYTELVKQLKDIYGDTETIRILNENIRLVKAPIEASRTNQETYFIYDDLKYISDTQVCQIIKTYAASTDKVIITSFESKEGETPLEKEVSQLLKVETSNNIYMNDLTKLIYQELTDRGFSVQQGIGRIDLMIKGKIQKGKVVTPNVGIIIEGMQDNCTYSIVEDYQYYNETYSANNWQIYIFFVDDLIENLQAKLDVISQFLAAKSTRSMHQFKIDDFME